MEKRIKVLWLPAWFPSKQNFLNGDFIERHAQSVSKYVDVTVIYVFRDITLHKNTHKIDLIEKEGLKIYVGYYNCSSGFSMLSKVCSFFKFFLLQKKIFALTKKDEIPFDLVHVHISQRQALFAHFLRLVKGIKYVISEQNSWFMPLGNQSFTKSFFLKLLVRYNFKKAKAIHTVSNSLGNMLKNKYPFINNYMVIPNVVDDKIFYYLPIKKIETEIIFFAITGNIYHKNTDGIIRAFYHFLKLGYDAKLQIAGPNTVVLSKLVNDLSIQDKVVFFGTLPYNEIAKLMQACDAFVFFTRYETFGCVMAEALCCGKPVIATKIDVLTENLYELANAIFVEQENEKDLTEKFIEFTKVRHDFKSLSISQDANVKYNYDTIGFQFLKLYESVLKK